MMFVKNLIISKNREVNTWRLEVGTRPFMGKEVRSKYAI